MDGVESIGNNGSLGNHLLYQLEVKEIPINDNRSDRVAYRKGIAAKIVFEGT